MMVAEMKNVSGRSSNGSSVDSRVEIAGQDGASRALSGFDSQPANMKRTPEFDAAVQNLIAEARKTYENPQHIQLTRTAKGWRVRVTGPDAVQEILDRMDHLIDGLKRK